MGKQEFARILEDIVNDSETAGRVANGDFGDMASGELTKAEQALLSAAAGDLDGDVVGFNFYEGWPAKFTGGDEEFKNVQWTPNVRSALGYLKIDIPK